MNNIASCILFWLNDKGYYYQSYGKNTEIPENFIFVDSSGGQNKDNETIRFLNMIKEGFFGKTTFHFFIKGHKKMTTTVTVHLTYLRCCTGSKMYLLLRSDMQFSMAARRLKLVKCSMKNDLTWSHSWIISMIDLILKLLTPIMSSRWKRSQNTLVIVKSSMARQSQNRIIRRKILYKWTKEEKN